MDKKIESLKKKRAQLNARIQKLQAQQKLKQRKQDTRRKILIGAYTLEQAKTKGTEEILYQEMLKYLKRDIDKALFTTQEKHGN